MGSISLSEALGITEDTTRPFGMKWASWDESRNRGGELMEIDQLVRVGASHNRKANQTIVVRKINSNEHPYTVHIHAIMEVNKQSVFI